MTVAAARPPLRLTDNQRKVIEDKYLKGDPTPEAWLERVARNVALAEVLHTPGAEGWGLYENVRAAFFNTGTRRGQSTRWALLHDGLPSSEDRDRNFAVFLKNLERAARERPSAGKLHEGWSERFYGMLSRFDFLPNSPTLMNAGRDLQQLSACYVLPVPDSMEGITDALKAQALIHKSGGGTGFSFGRLRPAGTAVKSSRGIASGALSFMQVFDKMTDVVKQGGTRRGANMGILPCWHPEILAFIDMKKSPGVMENFNVSVAVDEKFMRAVERGEEYDLLNPRDMKPTGRRLNAREVFDKIASGAWSTGDPGLIFIDRINDSASNPTPHLGRIESTNPCGEQPLLPHEPCNLGSVNLSNFVVDGKMDADRLGDVVALAVRFLDDVIDVNNYPLPEIERMAKGNRRIGLGIMGWAEALVKLGIPYDSDQAVEKAREVMGFVNAKALEASESLAAERGAFPHWKGSVYDPASEHFRGTERYPRHAARTTIAPTGTIGLAAGLQGAGIEPFFALSYVRYNAKALAAVKEGGKADPKDVFWEVNPLFQSAAESQGFFGMAAEALWRKVDGNHKAVRGMEGVPADVQRLFPTAHDVAPSWHVKMQAAFQAHTDNAVSKTINMPRQSTVDDVRGAYLDAYHAGCKGITVYRDGSKSQQVLNLGAAPAKPASRTRDASQGISSEYYEIRTGHGPLHIHVDYDGEGPFRVFAGLSPVGTELAGVTSVLGVLLSKYLENGGDPVKILKHLNSIKGDRPFGLGPQRVDSIPHAIAIALREHLKKHGRGDEASEPGKPLELWEQAHALHCPECFSSNVEKASGCAGVTCRDCGHSECS